MTFGPLFVHPCNKITPPITAVGNPMYRKWRKGYDRKRFLGVSKDMHENCGLKQIMQTPESLYRLHMYTALMLAANIAGRYKNIAGRIWIS